jgi:hypothetical protein
LVDRHITGIAAATIIIKRRNENSMGGACSTDGRDENCKQNVDRKPQGKRLTRKI